MKKLRFATFTDFKEVSPGIYLIFLTDISNSKTYYVKLKLSDDELSYLTSVDTIPFIFNKFNGNYDVCLLYIDPDTSNALKGDS